MSDSIHIANALYTQGFSTRLDSARAGEDCCETMWHEKKKHYLKHAASMERVGLYSRPVVFSCYGRLHVAGETTVSTIAQKAARRMGVGDSRPLLRRAKAAIGVALWRRAVAMVRACLFELSEESLGILFGDEGSPLERDSC